MGEQKKDKNSVNAKCKQTKKKFKYQFHKQGTQEEKRKTIYHQHLKLEKPRDGKQCRKL